MKMKDYINFNEVLLIAIGIILLFPLLGNAQDVTYPNYSTAIKTAVTDPTSQMGSMAQFQYFMHTDMMKKLYSLRGYEPIWINFQGRPAPIATELRRLLLVAYRHGLPADMEQVAVKENGATVQKWTYVSRGYWDRRLEDYLRTATVSPKDVIWFELLATEAFLRYTQHIFVGRFDPRKIDEKIILGPRVINDKTYNALNHAVSNPGRLQELMDRFAPESANYKGLMTLLNYYRRVKLAGGWQAIPSPGVQIEPGISHQIIPQIRSRLKLFGYEVGDLNNQVYDEGFGKALRRFQELSDLENDGVIGANVSKVLRYLNVPVEARIEQLSVNMERLRWLPRKLGDRYVFVNLAMTEFRLHDEKLSAAELEKMKFKTINGKDVRQTPLMIDEIRYVNFNPTWTVPSSIAIKDKLPQLRADAGYLGKHGMKLMRGQTVVDPMTVDFKNIAEDVFAGTYTIVQMPDYNNALGVVKFPLVKNNKAIFMHDTNERNLFKTTNRHGSSGCIRLEKPKEFAEYLLADKGYTLAKINGLVPQNAEMPPGKTFSETLKRPMTVYIQYLTTEVGPKGEVRFADDVYGQDEKIKAALLDPKNNGDF
ncbi:L,D-transpeptidase family protein [Bdellovibrio sp. HCB288]|uniref:L,D-transpeptidase family protein n=1 Tax=Bdellovibrio sp. HCB288 TaxID=3394355 RepID=UPI0039B505CF